MPSGIPGAEGWRRQSGKNSGSSKPFSTGGRQTRNRGTGVGGAHVTLRHSDFTLSFRRVLSYRTTSHVPGNRTEG